MNKLSTTYLELQSDDLELIVCALEIFAEIEIENGREDSAQPVLDLIAKLHRKVNVDGNRS